MHGSPGPCSAPARAAAQPDGGRRQHGEHPARGLSWKATSVRGFQQRSGTLHGRRRNSLTCCSRGAIDQPCFPHPTAQVAGLPTASWPPRYAISFLNDALRSALDEALGGEEDELSAEHARAAGIYRQLAPFFEWVVPQLPDDQVCLDGQQAA